MYKTLRNFLFIALTSSLAACAGAADVSERDYDDSPPLANVDELLAGAPKSD